MAGTVKKLQFSEGTDVGAPTDLGIQSSTVVISAYANDAAYVTANGAAIEGSVYLNSTIRKFRHYVGGAWRNSVNESDPTDATKTFLVDVSGNTTGVSASLVFAATANRSYTFPDVAGMVALIAATQNITNKSLDNTNILSIKAVNFAVQDDTDTTKQVKFAASAVTTGTTRTWSFIDANSTFVGTGTTQILTNKDYAGGTASDANRFTLSKSTTATIDALTRKQATLFYDTTTNQVKYDDGSTLNALGRDALYNQASLKFYEQTGNGTNFMALTAPDAVTTDTTMKLPNGAGTSGQFLQTNGTNAMTWATPTTASESLVTKSDAAADYAILDADGYTTIVANITTSTARTVTLPNPANNTNRIIKIKKTGTGSGRVTIARFSSETIDGATEKRLPEQYDEISLQSDGTNWHVLEFLGTFHSHIRIEGGNGLGGSSSGETRIRNFTTPVVQEGFAITYTARTTTNGDKFTINADGMYTINYSDRRTNGDMDFGVSLNSAQLSTDVATITNTTRLALTYLPAVTAAAPGGLISVTRKLLAGDVIRGHTDGQTPDTTVRVAFSITRVAPL